MGVVDEDLSDFLQEEELFLHESDVLLLYTDGYTETTLNGRMMGTEGLAQRFEELCTQGCSTTALLDKLLFALKEAELHDDVTLVALQRRPELRRNS